MNIIEAIRDDNLFRSFLADKEGDLSTWSGWLTALRVVYGLPLRNKRFRFSLVRQCTGRDPAKLPALGFDTTLFLTGRRSGKSKVAAVIGGYEASLSGKEDRLSKGEMGLVSIISPTKLQSQIVKSYLRAVYDAPVLEQEIVQEDRDGFQLSSGIAIKILTGDYRAVRGFTQLAVIVDEAAFFGLTEESKVKSDSELIRAIRPALATCGGRLIAISSPYAKKGWTYSTHKRYFGSDKGSTLVWNCPSRTMNPTLPRSVVDEAMAEDLAAAKSEFMGEFRDDVGLWLPREVIEMVVVPGQKELLPRSGLRYVAFADVSGGRSDPAALAIGHREKGTRKVIVDFIRVYPAPNNPYVVTELMAEELRRYAVRRVTGDNYSAEFARQAFESQRIRYEKCDLNKSALYLELLPRICSREIELPDDERLIGQLATLERRTRSGGRDSVDHPPGGHDDLANVVAGLATIASRRTLVAGGWQPRRYAV